MNVWVAIKTFLLYNVVQSYPYLVPTRRLICRPRQHTCRLGRNHSRCGCPLSGNHLHCYLHYRPLILPRDGVGFGSSSPSSPSSPPSSLAAPTSAPMAAARTSRHDPSPAHGLSIVNLHAIRPHTHDVLRVACGLPPR